jgi:fumarylacetoacetate (FAA) hydrolase
MKLASLKGGRDGRLVVVTDDLAWCASADRIAPTLQAALDDWDNCEPQLRGLADSLEHGSIPRDRFHEHDAASPLPRAYQWAGRIGLCEPRGARAPGAGRGDAESFWTDPLMYQGARTGSWGPATRSHCATRPGVATWKARSL